MKGNFNCEGYIGKSIILLSVIYKENVFPYIIMYYM